MLYLRHSSSYILISVMRVAHASSQSSPRLSLSTCVTDWTCYKSVRNHILRHIKLHPADRFHGFCLQFCAPPPPPCWKIYIYIYYICNSSVDIREIETGSDARRLMVVTSRNFKDVHIIKDLWCPNKSCSLYRTFTRIFIQLVLCVSHSSETELYSGIHHMSPCPSIISQSFSKLQRSTICKSYLKGEHYEWCRHNIFNMCFMDSIFEVLTSVLPRLVSKVYWCLRCTFTACISCLWLFCGIPLSYTQSTQSGNFHFFLRSFHHDGKNSPGWWGWGVHALPLSLYLPSRTKLWCTLQLRGLITPPPPHFSSTPICTLWSYM